MDADKDKGGIAMVLVQLLMKFLEYQTRVLQRRCRCVLSILPAGFWHLLNECTLSAPCWAFPWIIYQKCMRVLGRHALSVHSPVPPPFPRLDGKQVPE